MPKKISVDKSAVKAAPRKRAAKAAKSAVPVAHPLDQDVQAPVETSLLTHDYPQAGETVTGDQYTLRLTAENAPLVEVSVDSGAWQPCRFSVGHWWYDWSDFNSGTHTLRARALGPDGGEQVVKRVCRVQRPDAELA